MKLPFCPFRGCPLGYHPVFSDLPHADSVDATIPTTTYQKQQQRRSLHVTWRWLDFKNLRWNSTFWLAFFGYEKFGIFCNKNKKSTRFKLTNSGSRAIYFFKVSRQRYQAWKEYGGVRLNEKLVDLVFHRYKTPFWNRRTRGCIVYCPECTANFIRLAGYDVMEPVSKQMVMVVEEDGGQRQGRNVPSKWIWRSYFALGSLQKMGDLLLRCNIWFRAWTSVRGRLYEIISLQWIESINVCRSRSARLFGLNTA